MRLKKAQKERLLAWIAEGLESDEINSRAAEYIPPFQVSRQQVDYYRKTREVEIGAIVKAGELDALTEGLATRSERVKKLKQLAALLEKDLFGGFLWTDDVKGVGSGDVAEVVEFEVFNKAEVDSYRGVLDDIAKEVGGRVQKADFTSGGEPLKQSVSDEGLNRAVSTLADALGEIIRPAGNGPQGTMDTAEQAAMVGATDKGR